MKINKKNKNKDRASTFFWKDALIQKKSTLQNVIDNLNLTGLKISLIINKKNIFVGTITDGDIRRGLVNGLNLKSKIDNIINKNSFTVKSKTTDTRILEIMNKKKIEAIVTNMGPPKVKETTLAKGNSPKP